MQQCSASSSLGFLVVKTSEWHAVCETSLLLALPLFLSFPPVEDDRAQFLSLLFVWDFFFFLSNNKRQVQTQCSDPHGGLLLSWQCQRISEAVRHELYKAGMKEHIEVLWRKGSRAAWVYIQCKKGWEEKKKLVQHFLLPNSSVNGVEV